MDTLVSREEAGWSVEQQRTAGERRRGQGWSGRTDGGATGQSMGASEITRGERGRKRERETVESRQGEAGPSGQPEPIRCAWMPPRRAAARLPPLMLPAVAAALTAAELLYLSSFSFSGGAR